MRKRILLVDDDALLCRSLAFTLERAGYEVRTAASAEEGLALAWGSRPDLVLLDIELPGMDGLEALRRFHRQGGVPAIFLTARRREVDEVLGLELGADDYVTKPFALDVLLARIKAALRHSGHSAARPTRAAPLAVDDLVIDPAARTATVAGQPVALPPRGFDLLYALASRAGQVVSLGDLLARVWGPEYLGEPQVVYVHIRWLREKLEADPNHPRRIISVRGAGYKLVPQAGSSTHAAAR
ncbi:MAG: response regulator transcription factor [Ardenticatenaceae bacterium]|nr:response regulator transcription factor [Ardenticatenaceae bacterium]